MTISRKIISLVTGGAIVLGLAGAAFAAPAVATGSVNVRTGPSTSYQRVDTLTRNEVVEVTGCRGGWCYVEKRGPDGWVSANYLKAAPQRHSATPSINFSFSFGNVPTVKRPDRHRDRWDRWDRSDRWDRQRSNNGITFSFGN